MALKKVKPIGIVVYISVTVYATFGGWPFPDGRYISIVGIIVIVIGLSIVECKLKEAFNEARIPIAESEGS